MTFCDGEPPRAGDPCCSGEKTDRLVVKAHRCAMAGLYFGDSECWEIGWRLLGEAVPADEIGPLFGRFYSFARALLAVTQKPLSRLPTSHPGLCVEEALALRMIETAQVKNYAGTLCAASALLGAEDLGGPLEAAQLLASFAQHGLLLRGLLEQHESVPSSMKMVSALRKYSSA